MKTIISTIGLIIIFCTACNSDSNKKNISFESVGYILQENKKPTAKSINEESITSFNNGLMVSIEATYQKHAVGANEQIVTYKAKWRSLNNDIENIHLACGIRYSDWNRKDFLLIPASVYNGNQFEYTIMDYPPLVRNKENFRLDMPTTIGRKGTPHIGGQDNSKEIFVEAGRTTTPMIGIFNKMKNEGIIVLSKLLQDNHVSAIRFIEEDNGSALLLVDASFEGVTLSKNEELNLEYKVYRFHAKDIQDLYDYFFKIRKTYEHDKKQNIMPYSEAFKLAEDLYMRNRIDTVNKIFRCADPRKDGKEVKMNMCFQLGWISGGMVTYPFLQRGNLRMREFSLENLNTIFDQMQLPSGFYYTMIDPSGNYYADGFKMAHPGKMSMIRKQGDWLYWSLKHFKLMDTKGIKIPDNWQKGSLQLSDAFVKLWEEYHDFGQFVDAETGELLIGKSCAGAIVPAGLALASEFYNQPEYLEVAESAARYYDSAYVQKGYTTGGPGDILSAVDSESAFAMLESFVVLYEYTGKKEWLNAAERMASQCASWVISYKYPFPDTSPLGMANCNSTGSVFASIVNKHGAPGICTLSGDALFRLARATGNMLYWDLIRDIAHGITQYVSSPERPLGNLPSGGICERVNTSIWEGKENIGGNLFASCGWVETALLATITELPGLYVQPDKGFFISFDHVEVKKVSFDKNGTTLLIHNPTNFDAEINVLAENSDMTSTPLTNPIQNTSLVKLRSGETKTINFSKD